MPEDSMKKGAWVFLLLASFSFVMFPSTEIFYWKRTVMSMAVLFFVIAGLCKKDHPTIRIIDIIVFVFTFLNFISHLWADHPSLTWLKGFHWLLLLSAYLIARNLDYKDFVAKQCLRVFLAINVLNYLFLIGTYFSIAKAQQGLVKLTYGSLQSIHLYYGTNANYIASLFVVLFPIYFLVLKEKVVRKGWIYTLMCIHITLLLTFNSKGAIIALIASSCFAIFELRSLFRPKAILAAVAMISTSILLVLLSISKPLNFLNQMGPEKMMLGSPVEERIEIWKQGFEIFADHPILGVGGGNWPIEFLGLGVSHFNHSYDSPYYYTHAHNLIVEVAGEFGISGVILLLFMFVFPFISRFKNSQNQLHWTLPVILAYIIAAQFYGVTYSAIENFHPAQVLCIFLIGLCANTSKTVWEPQNAKPANLLILFASLSLIWSIYLEKKRFLLAEIGELRGKGKIEMAILKMQELFDPILYRHKNVFPIKGHEGFLKLSSGDIDQAITLLEQALIDNPFQYDILYHTGRLFLHKKESKKARAFLERAYSINSTYYPVRILLARIALIDNDAEAFNEYLSFYDERIVPLKNSVYSEDVWNSNSATQIVFWRKLCTYEDQVIMLREDWRLKNLAK